MKKKAFAIEIKSISETGEFEGFAAIYDNEDRKGDVIEKGAFTRTLQAHGADVPILWQHNPDQPIGLGTLMDSNEGLLIKGQLNMDVAQAREAYSLMKQRAVKGLSIGYDALQWAWVGDTRRLKEIRVWETSVVTFPANERAEVIQVKSAFHADLPIQDIQQWNSEDAAKRVQEWAGDDTEKKSQAYLADVDGQLKYLIGDVVDGNLVIVRTALEAVSKEVKNTDVPEEAKNVLARYLEKAGVKTDKKSINFERTLRKLISSAYLTVSEVKTGGEFGGDNIQLLDTAIEALRALKTAATEAAPAVIENGEVKPNGTKSSVTQEGQSMGGNDSDSDKLHSLLENMRQFTKSLKQGEA